MVATVSWLVWPYVSPRATSAVQAGRTSAPRCTSVRSSARAAMSSSSSWSLSFGVVRWPGAPDSRLPEAERSNGGGRLARLSCGVAGLGSAGPLADGVSGEPALLPETVAPEMMAPEMVAPEREAPEIVPPEMVPPEIVPPDTMPADTVPAAIAPPDIAPTDTVPAVIVPAEMVPPEIVLPAMMAPEMVAPETVAAEIVAPEIVAPEMMPSTGGPGGGEVGGALCEGSGCEDECCGDGGCGDGCCGGALSGREGSGAGPGGAACCSTLPPACVRWASKRLTAAAKKILTSTLRRRLARAQAAPLSARIRWERRSRRPPSSPRTRCVSAIAPRIARRSWFDFRI